MGSTSCVWRLAGELPGSAGTAHPHQEPLGSGGVDRSLERWVSWTDGTSVPPLAGQWALHTQQSSARHCAEGKFAVCSALCIGEGGS